MKLTENAPKARQKIQNKGNDAAGTENKIILSEYARQKYSQTQKIVPVMPKEPSHVKRTSIFRTFRERKIVQNLAISAYRSIRKEGEETKTRSSLQDETGENNLQ